MKEQDNDLLTMLSHGVEMERKIANGNIKRLNAAIKSGCQDIELLDSLADPLFDTMLGLLGTGVGGNGYDWKDKTVGFLHDVAEDTEYSVKDVIRLLKKGLKEWKAKPDEQDWIDDFLEMITQYPNERLHLPSKEEWNDNEYRKYKQRTISDVEHDYLMSIKNIEDLGKKSGKDSDKK